MTRRNRPESYLRPTSATCATCGRDTGSKSNRGELHLDCIRDAQGHLYVLDDHGRRLAA